MTLPARFQVHECPTFNNEGAFRHHFYLIFCIFNKLMNGCRPIRAEKCRTASLIDVNVSPYSIIFSMAFPLNILRPALFFAAALFLQACTSHIVTTHEIIPAEKSKVIEASQLVANQLSMETVTGSLRYATIFYAQGWGVMEQDETLTKPDMLVMQRGKWIFNKFKVAGALQFTNSLSETECTSVFASATGDPYAWSKLYPALIRQQIALTEKRQKPYSNPRKDVASFIALNMLSPVMGVRYIERGNPLMEEATLKSLYIPLVAADAVTAGCLLGAVVAKRQDAKAVFLNAGISLGVVMRVLSMLNLVDLSEYNDLARTPYNLGIIRQ